MCNNMCMTCYVCVVKKLCRSQKNMLASAVNLKEVSDLVLTEWNEDWDSQNSEMRDSRYDVSPDVPKSPKVYLGKRQKLTQVALPFSHYWLILQLYKDDSIYLASLFKKYRERSTQKTSFLQDWSPAPGLLTHREKDWMRKIAESSFVNTHPMKISRAYYGDAFFCTARYQKDKDKVNDNRCVMMRYDDEDDADKNAGVAFGIITHMFYHQLFHTQPPRVVIFADWYCPIGFDDCGLMQVTYNKSFDSEKGAFLDNCEPVNLMIWPSKPFDFDWSSRKSFTNPETKFVVIHR